MAIRVQTEFVRKSAIRVIYYNYDDDEALVAATSVAISIVDPAGTVVVNAAAMTSTATGVYEYYYATTASNVEGNYQIEIDSLDSSYHTYVSGHFKLFAGINE